MTNSKLQAALDELERLRDTVRGFKERNAVLPDSDSDAGRALLSLEAFSSGLHKLNIGGLLRPGHGGKGHSFWSSILAPVILKFKHQRL
jgi:hypothetical protein